MAQKANPVVFIHGLWLHATSWESWQDFFSEAGYDTVAPGWPGDQDTVELARANPDSVANKGIDDVTDHYAAIIESLPSPPILIGHSFGGMIAEKLLGMNKGVAAVGIDAAQIKGVLRLPLSALHSTLPVFKNPANKHKSVSLTADQFRFSFGNAISEEESNQLYEKWAVPSPGRPLFEAAAGASRAIQRTRSTPITPIEVRFCSRWAARTTPSLKPSPNRHSSNIGIRRRRPTWSSSKIGATP